MIAQKLETKRSPDDACAACLWCVLQSVGIVDAVLSIVDAVLSIETKAPHEPPGILMHGNQQ